MCAEERDLYIAALARELRDEDRLFIGVNQSDVVLAAYLARQLWAPGLRFWCCGGPRLAAEPHAVGRRTYDNTLVDLRDGFFWQGRAFDEMGMRAPVCFAGGLQVDRRGNANLAGVPDGPGWRLRGPGSAGLPSLTTWAPRFYIAVGDHRPEALVTECARISVLGDPAARAEVGLSPSALAAVITPLARFEPSTDGLLLTELAPGVDLHDVAGRTGFPIRTATEVRGRPPVTTEESATLDRLRTTVAAGPHRTHGSA